MLKRIFHIMIVAFGLAAFAACSSDNDVASIEAPKPQASIVVTVTLDDNEANLGNLTFVFSDASGNILDIFYDTFVSGKTYEFSISSSATHLMVLGNVATSALLGATNITDLNSGNSLALGDVRYDELPMVGNTDLTLIGGGTTDIAIALSRVVARVGLDNVTLNIPAWVGTLTPQEVFMYSVNDLHFWYDLDDLWQGRNSVAATDGVITGELTEGGDTLRTYLGNRLTSSLSLPSSTDGKTKIVYYVYPHGFGSPTKLVLKGSWQDPQGNVSTTYYPIIVNHVYDALTVTEGSNSTTYDPTTYYPDDSRIEANKVYMIDLTITGKGLDHPGDNWQDDRDRSITDVRTAVTPWTEQNDTVYWDIIK